MHDQPKSAAVVRDAEMSDELEMLQDDPRGYYENLRHKRMSFGFTSRHRDSAKPE